MKNRREFLKVSAAGAVLTAGGLLSGALNPASANELRSVRLNRPQTGGNPALQLLEKRASSREFGPEPLPVPVLSNLLWAAFGINRSGGGRTAPSANNRQEIDIYVAAPDGLYLFDAKENALKQILAEDIRALTGRQSFVRQAAVNLVYVADMSKVSGAKEEEKIFYAGADTGFISQNVYLYCAAEGLATVVRALINKAALAKKMNLRSDQWITLAQSVGYPQ
jgi:SagB-type dehydrogenase family enzyme